jgi:Carboxypeptidase regulatory-like domain/TonB-dependent Receptor Plug Domain
VKSPVLLGLCACVLSLASIVFAQATATPAPPAQETKAAITGTVSDQTGAAGRGATVTVDNGAGLTASATSDGQGLYAITDLASGAYKMSVVLRGADIFKTDVVLGPGQILTMNVTGAQVVQPPTGSQSPAGEAAPPPTAAATAPAQAPSGNAVPPTPEAQPSGAPATPGNVAAPARTEAQQEQATQSSTPQVASAPGSFSGPGIGGSVTDQSGAVLVGASVQVSTASGVVQTVVSDNKGNYTVRGLPAGSYKVTVTMQGFKPFETDNMALAAGESLPLDAVLEAAGEHTEVNVSGQTTGQVETETAQVSGTITEKEVLSLGLNGRNFTQLIALTPGVSNQTGQDEAKVGVTGSVKYSVNGGRVEYNTFEVDGGDVLNAGLNGAESTLIVYPSLDAIQEVKVLTSNYGAQYGRTASGTVLVTTKSGGDQWHGDAYEFFRNEALNARNYFDQTTKAPLYRRNDFGFTVGGPIVKNKTYIFGSEEFRIEKSPTDQQPDFNRGVPSLAERNGNFNDVCPDYVASGGEFNPAVWPDCPASGPSSTSGFLAEFPNNYVGQSNFYGVIDPNAVALLSTNLIPLPNAITGCNSTIGSCYNTVISEPTNWREELIRLDHNFNSKIRLTVRYTHDSWNTTVPIPEWQHLPSNTVNSFPTLQNKFIGPGISAVAGLTQTISPTFLNQFTASFANSHITLSNVDGPGGANYQRPASLGEPGGNCQTYVTGAVNCSMGTIFNNGFGGKAPGIVIAGNNGAYGGSGFTADTAYMPWEHSDPTYSYRDDVTKSLGKHTLQFGAQAIFSQKNELNPAVGAATGDIQGLLTFSNINGGASNTGNAFANFLIFNLSGLGENAIQSYTQDSAQHRYYSRYQIGEPYVQDDWRISSRLTLNLGVRFSLFGLYYERYLAAYNWDPSAYSPALASQASVNPVNGQLLDASSGTPIPIDLANPDPRLLNGVVRCGINGVPGGCMKGHIFNPAPRVGFAWDPRGDGKTSIRGGYGMFYEHGTGEEANTGSLEASALLVLNMTQRFPVNYGCIGGSAATCATSPLSPVLPGSYPLNVTAIPTKAVWPYSQQWSFSVQHELPRFMVATVAYVGSKGTHLTVERQLNQLQPLPSALNPFGIHEPIVPKPTQSSSGDCTGYSSGIFPLSNGITVGSQNPAYINLEAACAGENGGLVLGSGGGTIATTPTPDVNTLRPYAGIGQIYALQNVANSSYNALQGTLRRTKGPLTIGGSYSYSHSIDNSSDRSDTTLVNSYDLRSNRASSNFDQRHLLSVSYIYKLPSLSRAFQTFTGGRSGEPTGDGQDLPPAAKPSRLLSRLGDDWEFSGITVFQSGTPFSVINGGGSNGTSVLDNAGVANGVSAGSYPDLAVNPLAPPYERFNSKSFGPLLANPNLFVAPRGLTFGDAGRNYLNNPHRLNFDMSLLKQFKVTEGSSLEFRAEAFNIFNHTQFRIYDPNLGNTGSNVISCYGGPNYSAGYAAPLDPVSGASTGTDCVTGSAFLHPVDAHRPRTIQLGLKYFF